MRWSVWKDIFAVRASPEQMMIGATVFFQRGTLPQAGRIIGNEADGKGRLPLCRLRWSGDELESRRVYWRKRSDLYVLTRSWEKPTQ